MHVFAIKRMWRHYIYSSFSLYERNDPCIVTYSAAVIIRCIAKGDKKSKKEKYLKQNLLICITLFIQVRIEYTSN